MWTTVTSDSKQITDYQFRRVTIDLGRGDIRQDTLPCRDMEDFLGGIGRSFKLLDAYEVTDAFAPASPLLMNLGIFSGTEDRKSVVQGQGAGLGCPCPGW